MALLSDFAGFAVALLSDFTGFAVVLLSDSGNLTVVLFYTTLDFQQCRRGSKM